MARIAPYLQDQRTRCFVFLFCGAVDVAAWGTGVIFTSRLTADACATERQFKGAGETPAVRKKLIRVAYAEPVDCVGAAGLR